MILQEEETLTKQDTFIANPENTQRPWTSQRVCWKTIGQPEPVTVSGRGENGELCCNRNAPGLGSILQEEHKPLLHTAETLPAKVQKAFFSAHGP